MRSVLTLAQKLHGGTNVYKSRSDCLSVLHAVEDLGPAWWKSDCTDFLRLASNLDAAEHRRADGPADAPSGSSSSPPKRHAIIVVEGLDGTGKTLTTRTLAEKLGGVALSTPPPQFGVIREAFRNQEEAVARAFYCAANYVAADGILRKSQSSIVVVDRWWCSTCAMALANQCTVDQLPPAGDAVYAWPTDLAKPDAGFLLAVDEAVRVARIRKRAPEELEERRLAAQSEMRRAAMEAFTRTNMLTAVPAVTYREAVNEMLVEMSRRGFAHNAVAFTEEELNSITPV